MKKLILLTTVTLLSHIVLAQQEAMFTHYTFNTIAVNPAYAGSRDVLTATAIHRSQWVGFAGAPVSQTFTVHSPIGSENIGLGLSALNDKIGPMNNTSFYLDFSYTLNVNDKGRLAFGLKGGGSLKRAQLTPLVTIESNDKAFLHNLNSKFLPNFGFGMYYHQPRFYIGASVPNFVQNSIQPGNKQTQLIHERRHYYLISGTQLVIGKEWEFKPTGLLKMTQGAPVQMDITTTFIAKQAFHLGAMYRTGDALGALLGFNISEQLYAGYSFDWSYGNTTGNYNKGSHEVVLRYDFLYKNAGRIKSPRYF